MIRLVEAFEIKHKGHQRNTELDVNRHLNSCLNNKYYFCMFCFVY